MRVLELDPKYCDVIIRRWESFTGEPAKIAIRRINLRGDGTTVGGHSVMAGRRPKPTAAAGKSLQTAVERG